MQQAVRASRSFLGAVKYNPILPTSVTATVPKDLEDRVVKVRATELESRHVDSLAHRDGLLAIIVEGFYPQIAAQALAQFLYSHPERAQYNHEIQTGDKVFEEYLGVDRIGIPFNTFYSKDPDHPEWVSYFSQFAALEAAMAGVTEPAPSPFAATLQFLGKAFTPGAKRADFAGQPMFAGIPRVTHSNKKTEIMHIDALPSRYATFAAQLSFNVFCAVPEEGGELEVLDAPALTPEEVKSRPQDHDWGSEGDRSLTIKPGVGDLVLINTRRPHATRTFDSGIRVAVASFIGYNPAKPLEFWSQNVLLPRVPVVLFTHQ